MATLNQQFAQKAFVHISSLRFDEIEKKKYGSMAHKFPVLVRTAGLMQALAFVEARSSDPQKELVTHLAEDLGFTGRNQLLARARTADLSAYMQLTRRVLAAALWYKRLAESVLGIGADEDPGGEG